MLVPLLFVCISQISFSAAKLPPEIKLCKNDDKLEDCILKQAPEVIKVVAKGLPNYGVPPMDPMVIPKIEQTESSSKSLSMNFTLENLQIIGLSKAEILEAKIDTDKKFFRLKVRIPQLDLISDYDMKGKFLLLPLTGKGKATAEIDDMTAAYTYIFKVINKNGVDYVTSVPPAKFEYEAKKMKFNFENLFNGDKTLGEETNKVINENWQEFDKQIGTGVGHALSDMFTLVLDKVTGTTPYNELFLK